MTGAQQAEIQAADALPRRLLLIATVGLLSIAVLTWSFYAGHIRTFGTPVIVLNFLLNTAIIVRSAMQRKKNNPTLQETRGERR